MSNVYDVNAPRVLNPRILETKQELLMALKTGQIRTSRYNFLSEREKLFVEMIVFGGYTGEQAIRVIEPGARTPITIANRMLGNPDVAATLEELSVAKEKKFMAEVSNARDMALSKLVYIMGTTADPNLAASIAKVILDKAADVMKAPQKKEEPVGEIKFSIQVENLYAGGAVPPSAREVIIPISSEEEEAMVTAKTKEIHELDTEIEERRKKLKTDREKLPINPTTGMPYTLVYEGMDLYNPKKE